MAQYPIDRDDRDNIADAVNNLLSGPSGLGQNFAGFSAYLPAYLTGNYRVPFTQETPANLFVSPISLSTCEMLDERTWKYNFAYVQPTPPFSLGAGITITGVDNPDYDGTFTPIGVVQCTTSYVICRTDSSYPLVAPSANGTAEYNILDTFNSTDANAKCTVTGGTDRVFIGAQLDQIISYNSLGLDDLNVTVAINRYVGFITDDPTNPDYRFIPDKTVSQKQYTFTNLNGTGEIPLIETVFATIIDSPGPGYYWYILDVEFSNVNGLCYVTQDELRLRDLSVQVVKQ